MSWNGRGSARRTVTTMRMGPINIFTLVVVLCLAVMAVLAVTTAQASWRLAEQQASFTQDDYANEALAQELLAHADAAAAGGADAFGVAEELTELLARGAVSGADGTATTVIPDEGQVGLHVEAASGRCLDVVLAVETDGDGAGSVRVTSWKATTLWDEDTGDVLWGGNADASTGEADAAAGGSDE